MIVIDVDIKKFHDALEERNFSLFRASGEEVLICVSSPGLDYVGLHLIPPIGKMAMIFCDSWFGERYERWIKNFSESKKRVGDVQRWMKKNNAPLDGLGKDVLFFPISIYAPRTFKMALRDFLFRFGLFCEKGVLEKAIAIFRESEETRRAWAVDEGFDFGDVIVNDGLQYYKSCGLGVMPLLQGVEESLFPSREDKDRFVNDVVFSSNVFRDILCKIRKKNASAIYSVVFNVMGGRGLSRGIQPFKFLDKKYYVEYNSLLLDICLELEYPFIDEFFFFGENSVEKNNIGVFDGDGCLREKFQYYKELALRRSYWIPDGLLGGL